MKIVKQLFLLIFFLSTNFLFSERTGFYVNINKEDEQANFYYKKENGNSNYIDYYYPGEPIVRSTYGYELPVFKYEKLTVLDFWVLAKDKYKTEIEKWKDEKYGYTYHLDDLIQFMKIKVNYKYLSEMALEKFFQKNYLKLFWNILTL